MTYYLLTAPKRGGFGSYTFAIILKRNRDIDTINAMRIAINGEFNCNCKPGAIDLDKVNNGEPQTLHVTNVAGTYRNIKVSTAHLY